MKTRLTCLLATLAVVVAPLCAKSAPASASGGSPVKLKVRNRFPNPVRMMWVDFAGKEQDRGLIQPMADTDAPLIVDTFSGHLWHFRHLGQVPLTYTASAKPGQQVLLGAVQATPPVPVVTKLPPGGSGDAVSPEIAAFLKVHNDARAQVGAPPLRWSAEVAAVAQEWADQLAAQGGSLVHRTPNQFGENLFGGSAGFSPADAANNWLGEKRFYRGGPLTHEVATQAGHYTQMVWAASTQVGFGVATTRRGQVVIVANYSPRGNVLEQSPF